MLHKKRKGKNVYINKIGSMPFIVQANSPAFGAKINLKSPGIAEYCDYLERSKNAPKGHFSSNHNIDLFSRICKAFEDHPSKEVIETNVIYRSGELFNARGVLETTRGKITDIEPSRSDDGLGPMQYLFRKLLHPDNQKVFNGLLGEEYSNIYSKWWNENIRPLWSEIGYLYKFEVTVEEDNLSEKDFNRFFRKQFRKKDPIKHPIKSVKKTPVCERLKQAWKVLKGN